MYHMLFQKMQELADKSNYINIRDLEIIYLKSNTKSTGHLAEELSLSKSCIRKYKKLIKHIVNELPQYNKTERRTAR
jgi:hypothetical protein